MYYIIYYYNGVIHYNLLLFIIIYFVLLYFTLLTSLETTASLFEIRYNNGCDNTLHNCNGGNNCMHSG